MRPALAAWAVAGAALAAASIAERGFLDAPWPAAGPVLLALWAAAALPLLWAAARARLPGRQLRRALMLVALLAAAGAAAVRASAFMGRHSGFVHPPLDQTEIAGASARLVEIEPDAGPGYTTVRALLLLERDGREVARLAPESRTPRGGGAAEAVAAHGAIGLASVSATLRPRGEGRWLVTLGTAPFGRLLPAALVLAAAAGLGAALAGLKLPGRPARDGKWARG